MIYVIIGFLLIGFIDLPELIKQKKRRELIATASIFLGSLIFWTLHVSGVQIPSPMMIIGNFMKYVLHISY